MEDYDFDQGAPTCSPHCVLRARVRVQCNVAARACLRGATCGYSSWRARHCEFLASEKVPRKVTPRVSTDMFGALIGVVSLITRRGLRQYNSRAPLGGRFPCRKVRVVRRDYLIVSLRGACLYRRDNTSFANMTMTKCPRA